MNKLTYPNTFFQKSQKTQLTKKAILTCGIFITLFHLSPSIQAKTLDIDPNARLTIGVNATYNYSAYQGKDLIYLLPQAFYDNNRWYIEGSKAGRYLYKDKKNQLRVGLNYDGRYFNPENASDELKNLDKRQWSVLAGISYMRITPYGGFRIKASTDVLNRHNGQEISLSHLSLFKHNDWTVYPEIGVQWHNQKYNDYYYGVNDTESANSKLARYQGKQGFIPFANLAVSHRFNDHLSGFVSQKLEYMTDQAYDSPLIDDRIDSKTRIGINYRF